MHTINATAAGLGAPEISQVQELLDLVAEQDLLAGHPLLALVEPGIAMVLDRGGEAQEAVRRNLEHPDPWARAMLHLMGAMMAENDGDIPLLERELPLALEGFREIGDRWGIGTSVAAMGNLRSARGDTAGAIAAIDEAREMVGQLRARSDEAYSLIRIGLLKLRLPDVAGARRDVGQAWQIAEESGASAASAYARYALGVLAHHEGDDDLAREYAEEALEYLARIPFTPPQVSAVVQGSLAILDIRQGRLDDARVRLAQAINGIRNVRDMPIAAIICTEAADLALAEDDPEGAAELIGVGTAVRGMEDVGDLDLKRITTEVEAALGEEKYHQARERGAALTRPEALAHLDTFLDSARLGVAAPPQTPS